MSRRRMRGWSGVVSAIAVSTSIVAAPTVDACTHITLEGADGTVVSARTMEWAGFDLEMELVVIPRGVPLRSLDMPDGGAGASWPARYGLVGIHLFGLALGDAMNERGLTVALLYLPGFAEYQLYDPEHAANSITAMDFPKWVASRFATVKEVREALGSIRVVPFSNAAFGGVVPVHYAVTDRSGEEIVVEYVRGELQVFDAPLRVMTNSPPYDWHLTNLRNYLNLSPVAWSDVKIAGMDLAPLGVGSGMLGLPGDITPPSRFVRAVAFTQTARPTEGGFDTVREVFRIMDNFNVPIQAVEKSELDAAGLKPLCCSGTQYTSAYDMKNLVLYYHTDDDRVVRKVDLGSIDFGSLNDPINQPLRGSETTIIDVTPRP